MTAMDPQKQREIIAEMGVSQPFDAAHEAERRVQFLVDYLQRTRLKGLVLGISGGVDSSTAGRLCQVACEQVRGSGGDATFIAVRLPYGVQADEVDAQRALEFVRPDEQVVVDVKPATDATWAAVRESGSVTGEAMTDFVVGNVKARQRMVAQYAIAGARGMLVVGTDHAAEATVGFYTKYGDGACDLVPLAGLTKGRVRAVATHLGSPPELVGKVPTADLESERPQQPDEEVLGVSYADLDAYLEGKDVSPEAERVIVDWHTRTAHKRAMPAGPDDV